MKMWKRNLLLCIFIAAIIVTAIIIGNGSSFQGTDNAAKETIKNIDPDFKPWINSFLKLKSQEMETLFFSLQAAIGGGIIGFCFGRLSAKANRGDKK